jgi:dienelactone hydrolase
MTAYLFSAVFSTFYLFRDVYWLFAALLFSVAAFIARSLYSKKFRPERIHLAAPVFCSAAFCLALLSYGFILNSRIPYACNSSIYQANGKSVRVCKSIPKAVPKAAIVYLFCSDRMTLEKEASLTIRPLLARNYAVIAAGVDSGLEGLAQAEMLLKKIAAENGNAPLFLMGQGDGAKHAILIASKTDAPRLSAVVALGAPANWPFEELSPDLHIHGIKAPLLLIHGRKDYSYSYTDSETLKKLCDKSNIPATLQLIPDAGSYFDGKRNYVLNAVDAFITKRL